MYLVLESQLAFVILHLSIEGFSPLNSSNVNLFLSIHQVAVNVTFDQVSSLFIDGIINCLIDLIHMSVELIYNVGGLVTSQGCPSIFASSKEDLLFCLNCRSLMFFEDQASLFPESTGLFHHLCNECFLIEIILIF